MLSLEDQFRQMAVLAENRMDKAYFYYRARQARNRGTALTRINYEVRAIMYGYTTK